ncbi:MAG: radical SAM protein [Desulfobacterales bacterium]|nr:radical SAM protein [Desulfobacterales bacterium]
MVKKIRQRDRYAGFEHGPSQPASEAQSLSIRLTRGCPWNRCSFCTRYQDQVFSIRSLENILKDIELIREYMDRIRMIIKPGGAPDREVIQTLYGSFPVKDRVAFNAAMAWHQAGGENIFLQEADPLVMDPGDARVVLEKLRSVFPRVKRITTSARSRTLSRLRFEELEALGKAGLDRIHVGMESGSNRILTRNRIGATRETHIRTGIMVKAAGIELSSYIMPGLGGVDYSVEHALETASALNVINPHFIRLRSLAMPPGSLLAHEHERNRFDCPTDPMVIQEIRLVLESLTQVSSQVRSDSPLNLFENLRGRLPRDRSAMISVIDQFFDLSPQEQVHYQVGRGMGYFTCVADMRPGPELTEVRKSCLAFGITPDNVRIVMDEMKRRFV